MMGLQHTTFFFLLLFGLSTENRGDHHAPPPQLRLTDGYSALLGDPRTQAESGDADAQFKLGNMYLFGQGMPQDEETAASWYQKAAQQGHREAMLTLGLLLQSGRGVSRSLPEAYVWFSLAADQQDPAGTRWRDTLAASLSPSELIEARKRITALQPPPPTSINPGPLASSRAARHAPGHSVFRPPPRCVSASCFAWLKSSERRARQTYFLPIHARAERSELSTVKGPEHNDTVPGADRMFRNMVGGL